MGDDEVAVAAAPPPSRIEACPTPTEDADDDDDLDAAAAPPPPPAAAVGDTATDDSPPSALTTATRHSAVTSAIFASRTCWPACRSATLSWYSESAYAVHVAGDGSSSAAPLAHACPVRMRHSSLVRAALWRCASPTARSSCTRRRTSSCAMSTSGSPLAGRSRRICWWAAAMPSSRLESASHAASTGSTTSSVCVNMLSSWPVRISSWSRSSSSPYSRAKPPAAAAPGGSADADADAGDDAYVSSATRTAPLVRRPMLRLRCLSDPSTSGDTRLRKRPPSPVRHRLRPKRSSISYWSGMGAKSVRIEMHWHVSGSVAVSEKPRLRSDLVSSCLATGSLDVSAATPCSTSDRPCRMTPVQKARRGTSLDSRCDRARMRRRPAAICVRIVAKSPRNAAQHATIQWRNTYDVGTASAIMRQSQLDAS